MDTLVINSEPEIEAILEQALELVQRNRYKPGEGFYITEDSRSHEGDQDFCGSCIKAGVRKAERSHKKERAEIIRKHKEVLAKGFYMNGRKKVTPLKFTVLRSLVNNLERYPVNAEFSYAPYDPNFSGWLESPDSCDKCGRYLDSTFTPDEAEAGYLLELVNDKSRLSERDKWELTGALEGYDNIREDSVKEIMVQVAQKLIERKEKRK